MSQTLQEKIDDLKKAITIQECMRDALGSEVVDVTIAILHKKVSELEMQLLDIASRPVHSPDSPRLCKINGL